MPGPLNRSTSKTGADGDALRRVPDAFHSATLTEALTLDATYPGILKLDPGGAHRYVTLDAIASNDGLLRRIVNAADAAENLVVKNAAGDTIATINQNEQGEFYCNGSTWVLINISTIALS